jgi:hypothetical protein
MPSSSFHSANMTTCWRDHGFVIIAWVVVGVLLMVFLAWCYVSGCKIQIQLTTLILRPRRYPNDHDVELAALPYAFVPEPLYENHERDVWMPDYTDLEKHADGYHYPKHLETVKYTGRDSSQSHYIDMLPSPAPCQCI